VRGVLRAGEAEAAEAAAGRREELRARLRAAAGEMDGAGWLAGDEGHDRRPGLRRHAAVLLGLVARPDGPNIILTRRSEHLRDHGGQISLPGGRLEPGDAGPAEAALREAREEIGLAPGKVELLGGLRHYDTVTGFRIHPVVGWIEPPVELTPDPYEVAEVFELPLSFALDPLNHRRDSLDRNGERRHFNVLPYQQRYIWGATAGILVNFARLLAG
jgi:8-oxo-dGTP pyrophosphatase MutT (NUDIX family)